MIAGITASGTGRRSAPPGDLDGIFPNKTLGVLFYKGEKHPGGGGGSNTEWDLAPGDGLQMPSGEPYPGVTGQINYDLGPFVLLAGDGPIQMANEYYLHYLVQSGSVVQVIITTEDLLQGVTQLDPDKKDDFNAWWDEGGQKYIQLFDGTGAMVSEIAMSAPTNTPGTETDPAGARVGFTSGVPWTNKEDVTKMKLVSGPPLPQ